MRKWPLNNSLSFLILIACIGLFFLSGCKSDTPSNSKLSTELFHHSFGTGSPIIVIHGGPGLGSAYLEPSLKKLSETNQVIFYDQRNSGRSPVDIDSSNNRLAVFINDIETIRNIYGGEKLNIVAHSWGGLLAMKYALMYPNNITRLILINSNSASSDINEKANTKLANKVSADDIEARTTIMRSEAFKRRAPEAVEDLMLLGFAYQFSESRNIDDLKLQLPEDFGAKSQHLGSLYKDLMNYDFTNELTQISVPTLLLYGLDDPLTPFALNSMSPAFPNATIKAIDNAGHFPFIEKPAETLAAITQFLVK